MTVLELFLIALTLSLSVVLGGTVFSYIRHKRREASDAKRLAENKAAGLNHPTSIYPIIDPDICSGCLSCLNVCPEGDLFGVKNSKAILVEPSKCIGHGICVDACPTGAIKLVFGTKERGVDLPETDEHFETARPGLHIVGELGGIGLIKNALKQGLELAKYLKESLDTSGPAEKDVAIIGAGPAGIATALGCRAMGLSFRVIDQGSLGGAVAAYPRQKLVMMEPVKLPLYGTFGKPTVVKEELIEAFKRVCKKGKIQVHERVRALDVRGEDGNFTVVTDSGAFGARKVILAIGRRGSPRKLGVEGEESAKVTYSLTDPEQYSGKRVLVVGGGDSAIEAACMLAEEGDIDVSLSYRKGSFQRCRQKNRERILKLAKDGELELIMNSQVKEIRDHEVILSAEQGTQRIPNDYVIICAGGTLPTDFLKSLGINVKRYHAEAPAEKKSNEEEEEAFLQKYLTPLLYSACVLMCVALSIYGWDYYPLEKVDRIRSDLHQGLRPSGFWGHGVGVLAGLFMLSNFCYTARKRLGWFRFFPLSTWMSLHVFFGLGSCVLTAYHSAFQSNNFVATATTIGMFVVVTTGLIGRYLFSLLPTSEGKLQDLRGLKERQTRLETQMHLLAVSSADPRKTQAFAEQAASVIPAKGNLLQMFLNMPQNYLKFRKRADAFSKYFDDRAQYQRFRKAYFAQLKTRLQIIFYASLRRTMTIWRLFHVSLACMLVVLVGIHIGVSLYLGFGWVLF